MKRLIYILLAVCVLCSCKDSELRTNYAVFSYIQYQNGEQRQFATDVKGYAYYADTASWKVASWEDAVIGKLTSKSDETVTRMPDFTAAPDDFGKLVLGPITRRDFMLLVCHADPVNIDPENAAYVKMYAWRNAETTENLSLINVSMMFKPWRWETGRTETRWTESRWAFVNTYPEIP